MDKIKLGLIVLILALALAACGGETDQPAMETQTSPEAVSAAVERLSQELGVDLNEIEVVSFEEVEWPDACLGFAEPDEMCAEVLTPGWQIVLSVDGERYEFHTDQTGDIMRWQME